MVAMRTQCDICVEMLLLGVVVFNVVKTSCVYNKVPARCQVPPRRLPGVSQVSPKLNERKLFGVSRLGHT